MNNYARRGTCLFTKVKSHLQGCHDLCDKKIDTFNVRCSIDLERAIRSNIGAGFFFTIESQ